MEDRYYIAETNPVTVPLSEVPVMDYSSFRKLALRLMQDENIHCLTYFAVPFPDHYRFLCLLGDDTAGKILILSFTLPRDPALSLDSLSAECPSFHIFEREILEEYDFGFNGHPWLKPVRYREDGKVAKPLMAAYPFYAIDGEELHEVGVGPVHAGIIEPGYFRFLCHGEHVHHLEIQLGYQHRGIERLMEETPPLLRRTALAESIAGDTAIGHSLAFAGLMESMAGYRPGDALSVERTVALELERIAMHIADTAALCTDIGYQFGQAVNEALRTIVINTTQLWCGNRFGKGLIRVNGSHYPLTGELVPKILANLDEVAGRYLAMADRLFSMPSVLGRFEGVGKVTAEQARKIGAVGMAARSSGISRDTRASHPFLAYRNLPYEPVVLYQGDVWARAMVRKRELERSVAVVKTLLGSFVPPAETTAPVAEVSIQPLSLGISLTEGWRGEICHAAVTDNSGRILKYRVKDPSLHNWLALALAVRNQEISDFPLCNKSFNLSYCGNDL